MPAAVTIAVLLFGMTVPKRDFQKWPFVTLDDLVKLHDRLELPYPPADAKFVVWEYYGNERNPETGVKYIGRGFGFLARPRTRANPEAVIYWGGGFESIPLFYRLKIVPPEPSSIREIKSIFGYDVLNAIYCRKLGYEKLGDAIYSLWRPFSNESPSEHLLGAADTYWNNEIGNPDRKRATIIRMLKALNRIEPDPRNPARIESLELSEKPKLPANDPHERLFNQWVNSRDEMPDEPLIRKPAVRELLKQGFESVTSILDHLDDRRMTRMHRSQIVSREYLTVGQICGMLLDEFAGGRIERIDLTEEELKERKAAPPGMMFPVIFDERDKIRPLKREAVNEWWNDARAGSEKEYWIEKSLSKVMDGISSYTSGINETAIIVLAHRYPAELKSVYENALEAHPPKQTQAIAEAIANSMLDRAEKRRCLELGLSHRDRSHRVAALRAFSIAEPDEYTNRLIRIIERVPSAEPDDPVSSLEEHLISLCCLSKDANIWSILEKTIRQLPLNSRFQIIGQISMFDDESGKHRRNHIRLLAAFLDDPSTRTPAEIEQHLKNHRPIDYYEDVLGNFVAYHLAYYYLEFIEWDDHRSPDEWACLRKWLKDEVEAELKSQTIRR